MAIPAKSLNCRISWQTLLPALGIDGSFNAILPQTLSCPICGSDQLLVCDDRVVGGQWGYCHPCKFAGDMLELAAAVWQLDIAATVVRVEILGLFSDPVTDGEVAAYVSDHVQYRKRLIGFWEKARHEPRRQASPAIRHLLRKFGLLQESLSPAWPEQAGRFVGAASRQDAEELFAPASFEEQERGNRNGKRTVRRGGGPGGRRLFKGRGFEDLLVVPFFDQPGRISAFLFIGRDADPDANDYVFKRANFGGSTRRVRQAGVGMLSALDDGTDPQLGETVFMISDPVIGLMLKAKGLKDRLRQLPIVLTHCSSEIQTLDLPAPLLDQKLVFWGDQSQLCHARHCNGLVSNYRISHAEVEGHLSHRGALDWLRLILKHAVPWQVELQRELRRLDPTSIISLLRQMEFTAEEMRDLTARCDHVLREKLKQCDPHRISRRRVIIGGRPVIETEAGWAIEKTGEMVSNMPVRVETVLTTDAGETFFRGVVPTPNGLTHFTLPAGDVERRGLFPCIRDFLLEQGVGLFGFEPRWSKRSLFIATQFNPPQLVTGADRIGWHAERRCFVFPKYTISNRGLVCTDLLPLANGDNVPAKHLAAPAALCKDQVIALSAMTSQVSIVWGVMAAVIHNIFAPAIGRKPCGLVLDGEAAQTTGLAAARALGCSEVDLRKPRRNQTVLERVEDVSAQHAWPLVLRLPENFRSKLSADWLDSTGPRNAILSLGPYSAPAVASYSGFFRIAAHESAGPLGGLRDAIAALVPAYCQDACRRKLWIDQGANHEVYNLLKDIAFWFEREGGDRAAVESALKLLSVGSLAPWACFVDIVFRMLHRGDITFAHSGFEMPRRRAPAVVFQTLEGTRPVMFVPPMAINRILHERRTPTLDLAAVERSLMGTSTWAGNGYYEGENGWFLHEGCWNEQLHEWRAGHPNK